MKKLSSPPVVSNHLQRNLLIIITVLILSSVLLVSSISHLRFVSDYREQSSENMQQLAEQISLNIDAYIDELSRLCLSPYYDKTVMQLLDTTTSTRQEALDKKREIEGYLGQVMTTPRKDILRVYVFSDTIYSCTRTSHRDSVSDYQTEQWYLDALNSPEYIILPPHTEASLTYFSVAKQICSLQNNDKIVGVIRVDANYNGIQSVCDRINIHSDSALLIMDDAGNVIYSHSKLPDSLSFQDIQKAATENDFSIVHLARQTYTLHSQTIQSTGWKVIFVNSYSEIAKKSRETLLFNLALAFCLVAIGTLISTYFVKKHLKPLYQTVHLMELVQQGNLDVRANAEGTSEIAYLNRTFNHMLEQIQEMMVQESLLTKQIYEAKYLQKEAQFDSLYRQIQPHFLFNTLNTISLLIKCSRNKEAISSIEQLAALLRGLIHTDKEITLQTELKITESYLHLQKLRHESLTFEIHAAEADADYRIPALTIQPLIENALIHGCNPNTVHIHIAVQMYHEGNYFIISVSDNGVGMDPEKLSELQDRLNHCDQPEPAAQTAVPLSKGIGLVNIQKRIHLKFGQDYGLKLLSSEGLGTTILVFLPGGDTECLLH